MSTAAKLFVPDEGPFEPSLDDELLRSIEAELGVKLPDSYVALGRTHNGGTLAKTAHPMNVRTSWAEDHIGVHSLAAIGRSAKL
ncbi:SMI1/KNR4 family protein [Nocardioides eburneiflavus]|uniref:SMI1/KNR4 family protein n=1 Tax=Nocardioides eburneiflavus TaxID=2518372 RepID=UPI001B2FEF88|nr:SMI1/KNR4 family protein [Nocardioides eburneiflavus]